MTRYRKKPVEVEAWQVGTEPVPDWIMRMSKPRYGEGLIAHPKDWSKLNVATKEGDWLVMDERGDIETVDRRVFEQTYEVVE